MGIDITGIELTPGNCGIDCLGNGEHKDEYENIIEHCCDECDYLMCCLPEHCESECAKCSTYDCSRSIIKKNIKNSLSFIDNKAELGI